MSQLFADLLAADAFAPKTRAAVNPKPRDVISAKICFPAHSSGPIPDVASKDLPNGVSPFPILRIKSQKTA